MGAWGEGNFENDSAADILGEVVEYLVKRIERHIRSYKKRNLTPLDIEDSAMAHLEILRCIIDCLSSARQTATTSPIVDVLTPHWGPSREQLMRWRETIVTAHISYFGTDASGDQRLRIIESTFDSLIRNR